MIQYYVGTLYSYEQAIKRAQTSCKQVLMQHCAKSSTVMAQRLTAYLMLSELCGGMLPKMIWSERGKPLFVELSLYCSLSHTDTGAAAIISDLPIGIDLQVLVLASERRLERVCCDAERVNCRKAVTTEDQNVFFTRVWTAKEAVSKALGTGIGKLSFQDIIVDLESGTATANGKQFTLFYPSVNLKNTICCIAQQK